MNSSFRVILLRIISITAVFCFLYPIILLLRTFLFKQNAMQWEAWYSYAIIISGFIIALAVIGSRKGLIPRILSVITVLVPAAITYYIYIDYSIWRLIFESVMCITIYLFGHGGFYSSYGLILNGKLTLFGTGIILLGILLAVSFPILSSAKYYTFTFAYIFLCSVLLISNQNGIDDAFFKRHIDKAAIPSNMRRYNTFLVILLFIIIAVFINIKTLVNSISVFIKTAVYKGILAFIWVVQKLNSLFSTESTENPPVIGEGAQPAAGKYENSLLGTIIYVFSIVFLIVMILFILHILRLRLPYIIKNIKERYHKFVDFLKRLLKITIKKQIEESDYQDEVQELKAPDPLKSHRKNNGIWKKSLRSITDPSEKVKFIYISILNKLALSKIIILKSDTTREILFKADELPGISIPFGNLTKTYEELKYGDIIPDNSRIKDAEENLTKISSAIGKIKK